MGRGPARVTIGMIVALIVGGGCAGDSETDVATVNGIRITAEQFRARYQKYLASTSMKDNIQVRKQVLQNMINELLIFEDLRASGAEEDSALRHGVELIRRQALADGYARRVTTDTMTITPQQLELEFRRYNTRVSARYVYARSEEGAQTLRSRLQQGETFESIARETFEDPGLANNGGSLGTFGWGDMEDALEEAAYTLPLRELSDPLRMSMGYAIVRVDSRVVVNPLASEADFAKVKGKLTEAIAKRAVPRLLCEHVMAITRSMEPEFEESTVKAIVAEWKTLAGDDDALLQPESALPPLQDLRGRNLVRLRGSWWTVQTLMDRLVDTKERQRRRVRSADDLKEVVLGLAARDEFLQRAESLGLEHDAGVAGQIENLSGELRLRHWAAAVQDTVGRHGWPDTLLRRVYLENQERFLDPPMVNVAEVLVRTEGEAKRVARAARLGADFGRLARTLSIRLWAAKRGGELGFNTRAGYGVMGEKFFAARVGDIVGPDRVDPYWGVFKVVERKEGRIRSFEESKEQTLTYVNEIRKRDAFQSALNLLRERAQISMNVEHLAYVAVH